MAAPRVRRKPLHRRARRDPARGVNGCFHPCATQDLDGPHSAAYDSFRNRIVVFGGVTTAAATGNNDTYEYDATNWYPTSPATRPAARRMAAMAYDALNKRTVAVTTHTPVIRPDPSRPTVRSRPT